MHLLITRPQPDADLLAAELEDIGHQCTVAPLMEISFNADWDIDTSGTQGLIITSQNALRALITHPRSNEFQSIPLYVVGIQTRDYARSAGFSKVNILAKTAEQLGVMISAERKKSAGLFQYISGSTVAFDMEKFLKNEGYQIARTIVYETRAAATLMHSVIQSIKSGEVNGVVLLSPKTAKIYQSLMLNEGLSLQMQRLVHFCLSENVSAPLGQENDLRIITPDEPSLTSMMQLLGQQKTQI